MAAVGAHSFQLSTSVLTDFSMRLSMFVGENFYWRPSSLTETCVLTDDGWTAGEYGPSEHRRLSEEGRGKPFLCADPRMKWNLQVAICKSHKEENGIMRSWMPSPRFATESWCHQKARNQSLCSSSRHILAWPSFYNNYQRQFKEQAAQKGFGDGQPSMNYLQAREYF